MKLQLAIAYFKTTTYSKPSFLDLNRCLTRCIALCRELSGPEQTNPLTAAWAKTYLGAALEATGQTQEAMRLYREVDSYIPVLTDLGPVLDARHRAADHFLRTTKFDPAHPDHPEILGFDSEDKEAWAWVHGALCARRAWGGDVEAAYREYDELVKSLPAGDERIAVAAIDLAIGEIDAYHLNKRIMMSMLVHAQDTFRSVEANYPDEKWLVAKAKIRMAEFMMWHKVGLEDAERYLREVVAASSPSTADLIPQAYCRLAELLYTQKRHAEAAEVAGASYASRPYSTWADYTLHIYAANLYRSGNKTEALSQLETLMDLFPESGWATVANVNKEVFWK
ncbi:MAG: hypothetical protein K6U00_00795 [Armatimonadetes bacterium]|nr:hypothetical protein [Armatimonadota bacterium]